MAELEQLRRLARGFENRPSPRATRYPESFREQVLSVARARQRTGAPVARIARDLGLRARTLTLWLRRAPKRRVRRVSLAPDVAAAPGACLSVRVGRLVIEGLDLGGVVALVRALGA